MAHNTGLIWVAVGWLLFAADIVSLLCSGVGVAVTVVVTPT